MLVIAGGCRVHSVGKMKGFFFVDLKS